MAAGVGCTRLAIHAVTANGEELNRVWRCAEPLTEDATADRVRWQLDGWLSNRKAGDRPTAPVTLLRLQAVEVVSAEALQLPLWGGLGRGGQAAGPPGAGAGAGSARPGGGAGARVVRRSRAGRTHHA